MLPRIISQVKLVFFDRTMANVDNTCLNKH